MTCPGLPAVDLHTWKTYQASLNNLTLHAQDNRTQSIPFLKNYEIPSAIHFGRQREFQTKFQNPTVNVPMNARPAPR